MTSVDLVLVAKRPSGPQQSHPIIQCWLKNCLKMKNKKNMRRKKIPYIYIFGILCILKSEKVVLEEALSSIPQT
jgi:hypothetical protein